jgi:hypothetical protein
MVFQPGQSGNPKGRPKAGESWAELMADVETPDDRRAILRKLITAAKRGEPWAQQLYHDRKFGKVPMRTIIDGGDDDDGDQKPVPIRILPQ